MNYKCKLIKVVSEHENLRTQEVEGITGKLPKVGERFRLLGKGLEFGFRDVTTSIIQELIDDETFRTEFSTYKLVNVEAINSDESKNLTAEYDNGEPK